MNSKRHCWYFAVTQRACVLPRSRDLAFRMDMFKIVPKPMPVKFEVRKENKCVKFSFFKLNCSAAYGFLWRFGGANFARCIDVYDSLVTMYYLRLNIDWYNIAKHRDCIIAYRVRCPRITISGGGDVWAHGEATVTVGPSPPPTKIMPLYSSFRLTYSSWPWRACATPTISAGSSPVGNLSENRHKLYMASST